MHNQTKEWFRRQTKYIRVISHHRNVWNTVVNLFKSLLVLATAGFDGELARENVAQFRSVAVTSAYATIGG